MSTSPVVVSPSPIRHQSTTVMEMVERTAQDLLMESACHLTVPALAVRPHLSRILDPHLPGHPPDLVQTAHPPLQTRALAHFRQILRVTITNNVANAAAKIVPRKKPARIDEVLFREAAIVHQTLHTPSTLHVPNLPSPMTKSESSFLRTRIITGIALYLRLHCRFLLSLLLIPGTADSSAVQIISF